MAKRGKEQSEPTDQRPMWMRNHIWQIQPVRDVLVIFAVFGLFWLGYKLSIVTVPILLALALAYLFDPAIRWLTRKGQLTRHTAVSGIIAGAVLLVLVPVTLAVIYGAGHAIETARSITRNVENTEIVRAVAQEIGALEAAKTDEYFVETGEDGQPVYPDYTNDGRTLEIRLSDEDWEGRNLPTDPPRPSTASELENAYGQSNWIFRLYQRSIIDKQIVSTLDREAETRRRRAEQERERAKRDASGNDGESAVGISEAEEAGPSPAAAGAPHRVRQRGVVDAVFDFISGYVQANQEALSARAVGTSVDAASRIVSSITSIGVLSFMAFLTAFFFYFIANAYGPVVDFLKRLLPEKNKEFYLNLATQMDSVISGFVRGRLTIAIIQSVFFTIAYGVVGVPFFFVLGPIVAVLSIIPYLSLVGIPAAIILMFVNASDEGFRGEWWWILAAPTIVYFIGQALDDYVWTPRIQGDKTGMDTPSILFATIAGGALAGFYGVLLAIPVAACLKILVKEIFWPRFKAWSEGKEKDFLPIGRS